MDKQGKVKYQYIRLLTRSNGIITTLKIDQSDSPQVIIYKNTAFIYWCDQMYRQADTLLIKEP